MLAGKINIRLEATPSVATAFLPTNLKEQGALCPCFLHISTSVFLPFLAYSIVCFLGGGYNYIQQLNIDRSSGQGEIPDWRYSPQAVIADLA